MAAIRRMTDIAGEAVLIAGGGRAILLQLAHPAIGHAIADHSDFSRDPMRRLRHTLSYIYAQVYGTDPQRRAAADEVNQTHARVVGVSAVTPYSADDADLQLWVAATLYDSALIMHEHVYGTLPPDVAESIYRDYAVLGTALRMPAELWPADRASFRRYFSSTLASLSVTDAARAQARQLLFPARAPLWLRAAAPVGRLVTAGLLPASVRSDFGMSWSPDLQRRFERVMSLARVVYPRLPARVRHLPRDRALAAAERMLRGA